MNDGVMENRFGARMFEAALATRGVLARQPCKWEAKGVCWRLALAAVALTMLSGSVLANEPRFEANDIETLFYISKSDDLNRVDYGMRLDSHCAPYGEEPVFPYWRQFEPPPPVRTKPMGAISKLGYGIVSQDVVRRTAAGGETTIQLKQVGRAISITSKRGANGRCMAVVRTKIANVQNAELVSIFVKLSGPLSVSHIDIKGKNPVTAKPIEERLRR